MAGLGWVFYQMFLGGGGTTKARPGRAKREGVEREKKRPPPSEAPQGMIRPAVGPGDRLLLAQAAQVNLTDAIIHGVSGLAMRWRERCVRQWPSLARVEDCRRIAILASQGPAQPGVHQRDGGITA